MPEFYKPKIFCCLLEQNGAIFHFSKHDFSKPSEAIMKIFYFERKDHLGTALREFEDNPWNRVGEITV